MAELKQIRKIFTSKFNEGVFSQSVARVLALLIPIISVYIAREFLVNSVSEEFFVTLTDTIAITAFARLGVDVYLPSCRLNEEQKLIIHPGYATIFHGTSVCLLMLTICAPTNLLISQGVGVSIFVIQGAMYAEIGRARGKFLIFYMFKSPIIYLTSLIWTIWHSSNLPALYHSSIFTLFLFVFLNIRSSPFSSQRVKWRLLVNSAVFSALLVIFSWKDAITMRLFDDPESLEVIVFYGRMKLAIMFVFALYNARVPNTLRNLDYPPKLSFLRAVARRSLVKGLLWGIMMSIIVLGFCALTEPNLLPVVSILLTSSLVIILYGNLGQIFIAMQRTGYLSIVYLIVIFFFLISIHFLVPKFGVLLGFSISGLVTQILLGLILYTDLPRNLNIAIKSGRWNAA